MPLYEYQCPTCGRFELIQKFSDAALSACPTCGKPVTKLLSAPAIQFKGAGWYVTDYAKKSGGEGAKAAGNGGGKEAASSSSSSEKSSPSTPSSTTSSASGSSPSK